MVNFVSDIVRFTNMMALVTIGLFTQIDIKIRRDLNQNVVISSLVGSEIQQSLLGKQEGERKIGKIMQSICSKKNWI